MDHTRRHHVVIVGSGFGGLFAAQAFEHAPVDVTVISGSSHHLFQPLLYQVATGVLLDGRDRPGDARDPQAPATNARTCCSGLVTDIDLDARAVVTSPLGEAQSRPPTTA